MIGTLPRVFRRSLSTRAPQIFDEATKVAQKARAAAASNASEYDYLRDEFAIRVVSRLPDIRRKFDVALDLGCGSGHIRRALAEDETASATIGKLIEMDVHPRCSGLVSPSLPAKIPLEDESTNAVLSSMWLHWVNDLGGALRECARVLKPDGVLLGCMPQGGTLRELRTSLQLAEDEIRGGLSAHISPFVRARDVGGALGVAGLSLATVDADTLVVRYTDIWALMRHLRAMGESNAIRDRKTHLGRDVIERAKQIYEERFSSDIGGVEASFEVVNFIAWKPAEGQQKPLERGTAEFNLTDLVDSDKEVKV